MTAAIRPHAIVLAGGEADPSLPLGVLNKSFLEVSGKPLAAWVLDALRAAPAIGRIVLVAPAAAPDAVVSRADEVVPDRGALLENVLAGLDAARDAEWALLCAADIPLLTPHAIGAFLDACAERGGDLFYGAVRKEAVLRAFPTAKKTFVQLVEGSFTGGSLILSRPENVAKIRPLVEQALDARKNPARLAQLVGAKYAMKFMMNRLSIADIETRMAELTGLRGRAVPLDLPEIALDVDAGKPENLALVEAALRGRAAADVH
jgi:molybdopterin-guanine dinucleotide biosynthesis protein A